MKKNLFITSLCLSLAVASALPLAACSANKTQTTQESSMVASAEKDMTGESMEENMSDMKDGKTNKSRDDDMMTLELTYFPKFSGYDLDGNKVDNSIFSEADVTLVNLWYNDDGASEEQMKKMEEFNKKLEAKGARVLGLNTEITTLEDKEKIDEAKEMLKKQGATYKNIIADTSEDEIQNFLANIQTSPASLLVSKEGAIVSAILEGPLSDEDMENILKTLDM